MLQVALSILSLLLIRSFLIRKLDWSLLWLTCLTASASLFVWIAPGNAVRYSDLPHRFDVTFSAEASVSLAAHHIINWLRHSPLLLMTVLYVPIGIRIDNKIKTGHPWFSLHPAISIGLLLILMVANSFPAYFSTGFPPPGRAENGEYLLFIIGWFFNTQVVIRHLNKKSKLSPKPLPRYIVIILALSIASIFTQKEYNNVRAAYSELLSGRAYRFDQEMKQRYKAIQECPETLCEIEKLRNPAYFLYADDDITANPQDPRNVSSALYFKKKAIKIRD
jgi:hypothetical protein